MAFTDLTIEETSNRIVKRLGVLVFLQHALGVVSALGIASSTYLIALGPRDALAVVGDVLVLAGVNNLEWIYLRFSLMGTVYSIACLHFDPPNRGLEACKRENALSSLLASCRMVPNDVLVRSFLRAAVVGWLFAPLS